MSEFENLLNEALANITISALSLNLWYDVVNGTVTQAYNIYRINGQLTFFLPYGLCFLFTLPVVTIGLTSLRHNGVSAIDGGFLQILMTAATGRIELEIAASKGHLGGYENIPKGLRKQLKVRFGELVTPEDTTEEARVLNTRLQIRSSEEHDTDINQSGEDISLMLMSQERQSSDIQDGSSSRAEMTSGIEKKDLDNVLVRRAGFGVFSETRPLRRGSM